MPFRGYRVDVKGAQTSSDQFGLDQICTMHNRYDSHKFALYVYPSLIDITAASKSLLRLFSQIRLSPPHEAFDFMGTSLATDALDDESFRYWLILQPTRPLESSAASNTLEQVEKHIARSGGISKKTFLYIANMQMPGYCADFFCDHIFALRMTSNALEGYLAIKGLKDDPKSIAYILQRFRSRRDCPDKPETRPASAIIRHSKCSFRFIEDRSFKYSFRFSIPGFIPPKECPYRTLISVKDLYAMILMYRHVINLYVEGLGEEVQYNPNFLGPLKKYLV